LISPLKAFVGGNRADNPQEASKAAAENVAIFDVINWIQR
jgi:hypothetical protein